MSKQSKIFGAVTTLLLSVVMIVALVGCTSGDYFKKISEYKFWTNKASEAIAQTHIHDMVDDHMSNENGKEKKVLLLGFDGMRADALTNIIPSGVRADGEDIYSGHNGSAKYSAINRILGVDNDIHNGKAYVAYCGGEKGKDNEQATSTAPGWAAITSGAWGIENGVVDNGMAKNLDKKTFMLKYAEEKKMDTAFFASWGEHFDLTYKSEIDYIKKNNISMEYKKSGSDEETHANVMSAIKGENEKDMIFAIYEGPDYNGHYTGFTNDNPHYVNGVRNTDNLFYEVIIALENRLNYANEDWLIILTADHGGMDRSHGMQKAEARTTFIVTNKEINTKYYSKNYDGFKVNG